MIGREDDRAADGRESGRREDATAREDQDAKDERYGTYLERLLDLLGFL